MNINPRTIKLSLLLFLSLGLVTMSYGSYLDDWPDDSICSWLEQKPTHQGYLGQAKKRGLNCGGLIVASNNKSETSIIGQSIYKTITQGDAEIYQAQMLLNRFHRYSVGSPNGQWTWKTQSATQKFYRELGQSFDGRWSSQILSDLKDRRLITMPRSGALLFAEKGENIDNIRLKNNDDPELEKAWYKLNQLEFAIVTSDEVGPPHCYPTPQDCTDNPGLYTPDAHNAAVGDFNGDGLQDLAISWIYFIHTTKREKTPSHIRFYLNDGKNNLVSSPEIYALNEVPLRHMLYRMVVDDFNSDGRDDLFVGSMGVIMRVKDQQHSLNDFEPNLLLLSTQNGQMEDASHLIEGQENGGMIENYTFSHATSSGDINCDGFNDIYTGNALLIGDGTGKFINKSNDLPEGIYKHTKANAFASTIADFNGDGCGDVVMHLQEKTISVWMSLYGKHMPRTFTTLKMENYYGKGNMKVNYMASGDLDGDGDPDLVVAITRAKPYYLGRKIVIFINQEGELIEKTKALIQDDRDQNITGRPQNGGEGSIRLVDHDRDGDLDIIDSTGGSWEKNGRFGYAIFENDGTGHFTAIPESEFVILREEMFEGYSFNRPQTSIAYPIDIDGIGRLDYVSFIRSPYSSSISTVYGYTVLGKDNPITQEELKKRAAAHQQALVEEQALAKQAIIDKQDYDREQVLVKRRIYAEELARKENTNSKQFIKALSSLSEVVFEGESAFNRLSSPIILNSEVQIMGYKDLKLILGGKSAMARLHLQFGESNVSTNVCFQWYPQHTFMAVRLSFMENDWGGIKDITKFGTHDCVGVTGFVGHWEVGANSDTLIKLGIKAALIGIQQNTRQLLEALDEQTDVSLSFLLSKELNK